MVSSITSTLNWLCGQETRTELKTYLTTNLKEDNREFKNFLYKYIISCNQNGQSHCSEKVISVLLRKQLFNQKKIDRIFDTVKYYKNETPDYSHRIHLRTLSPMAVEETLQKLKKTGVDYLPLNVLTKTEGLAAFFCDPSRKEEVFILYLNGHYTSFLAEKFDKMNFIYAIDSVGTRIKGFADYQQRFIKNALREAQIEPHQLLIFQCTLLRQVSSYGCEIFSMKDALSLASNPCAFKEWVLDTEFPPEKTHDPAVMQYHSLTDSFMKMTDCLSLLFKYNLVNGTKIIESLKNKKRTAIIKGQEKNEYTKMKLKEIAYELLKKHDCLT